MASTQATIGSIALQTAQIKDELQDLRTLVMDVLKEMLRISAMQAEATNSFMRLVEAQQELFKAQMVQGPGRSRDYNEQADFEAWRASLEERPAVTD